MKTTTILIVAAIVVGLIVVFESKKTANAPLYVGGPAPLVPPASSTIAGGISGILSGLLGSRNTLAPSLPGAIPTSSGQPFTDPETGLQIPSNTTFGTNQSSLIPEDYEADDPGFSSDSGASEDSSAFDDGDF